MKKFKLFLSAIFVVLLFNSCENEEDLFIEDTATDVEISVKNGDSNLNNKPELTLTFGLFFGKCVGGSCINIYKLTSEGLLEDSLVKYPAIDDFYKGKFVKIKGSEFINTKLLISEFPSELLGSKARVIGSPDAGDWGGVYLEYQDAENHEFWLLDLNTNNLPINLRNYVEMINATVAEIGKIKEPIKEIGNLN